MWSVQSMTVFCLICLAQKSSHRNYDSMTCLYLLSLTTGCNGHALLQMLKAHSKSIHLYTQSPKMQGEMGILLAK